MNIEEMIRNALKELTNDGIFQITQVIYDEKNFGNVLTILKSNEQVDIRFIKDRGDFWCEIGHVGEWYFLEDVFSVMGIETVVESNDFIDMVYKTSIVIRENIAKIIRVFDAYNSKDTRNKIKVFAAKRTADIFGK